MHIDGPKANTDFEHDETWGEAIARPGQLLSTHSTNVSMLASGFGNVLGISETLRIAGLWHDFGKNSPEFQEYIDKISKGVSTERGRVRHSIFGANHVYGKITESPLGSEILGNIIAAHHGELYDN
ncbi:MAG: CRISPR-associated endonuclease Cas3'', partial [Clostridiales bacterium]|nr:CRISPR-associated endonuclease Cas3'' [Clostridiales bacterium]